MSLFQNRQGGEQQHSALAELNLGTVTSQAEGIAAIQLRCDKIIELCLKVT